MTHPAFRTLALPVVMAGLMALSACTYWSSDLDKIVDQSGRDFKRDPGRTYTAVSLEEVWKAPSSYKLMEVSFQAVLNNRDESVFVPSFTSFKPEDYSAFSVWPVSARLWDSDERARSLPTLYMRKDCPDLQRLVSLDKYAHLWIRGVVMSDFNNLPYFEVRYVDIIDPAMYTDQSLVDMAMAMEASAAKRPAQAIQRFENALKGALGQGARVVAHMRLAAYYEERGDFENALAHFAAVVLEDHGNSAASAGADRTRKALERKRAIEAGEEPPK